MTQDIELDYQATEELLPRVLPNGWRRIRDENKFLTHDGMSIICGLEIIDGIRWWHVSCARPSRLPSWQDLRNVKDVFVGRNRQAVQILPAENQYVNIHPYCLHLWSRLDVDIVPDLRRFGQL